MDGRKTTFLLGRSLFRGKLLNFGGVPIVNCKIQHRKNKNQSLLQVAFGVPKHLLNGVFVAPGQDPYLKTTLPKTNISEKLPSEKETIVFQPSIFQGLYVMGRVVDLVVTPPNVYQSNDFNSLFVFKSGKIIELFYQEPLLQVYYQLLQCFDRTQSIYNFLPPKANIAP